MLPPVFWLGQDLLARGWAPALEGIRYPAYFTRTLQVLALLSLWPFLRLIGLRNWADLGLRRNRRGGSDLLSGLAFGAGGLGLVAAAIVLVGASGLRTTPAWHDPPAILLAALLVAVIEETLFRGALFGLLRRTMHGWAALLFLSAVYATLHFVAWRPGSARNPHVEWHSGFDLLWQMLWPFSDPRLVLGEWCTLLVAGLILGDCVMRTRSLQLAVGVHAGWVLGLRSFQEFFTRPVVSLWIGSRLTSGVVPLLMLLVTWMLLRRWIARRDREP